MRTSGKICSSTDFFGRPFPARDVGFLVMGILVMRGKQQEGRQGIRAHQGVGRDAGHKGLGEVIE